MAVSLLLLLSALTAVLGGLLFSLSRGRGGSLAYRNKRIIRHIRGGERSKLGARLFKTGTCRK